MDKIIKMTLGVLALFIPPLVQTVMIVSEMPNQINIPLTVVGIGIFLVGWWFVATEVFSLIKEKEEFENE